MQHSCLPFVSKPLFPHLPILYLLLPLPPHHCPLLLAALLCLLPPLLLLTLSGFFNGMLEVFKPGALNHFTFSRPTLSTLSASKNPILIHLPLSGFSSLRSDHTHSWFGILSPDAMHASDGVVTFVRQGLSFSELSTSSFSLLNPYSDYVGVNISLNNSSSPSFLNLYVFLLTPPQQMAETIPSLSPFFPPAKISSFWGTLIAIIPSGTQKVLLTPTGRKYLTGSSLLTSSLNDPDTPTLLHRSSGSHSSSDISFAPSSLALSCSWEVLQNLGSDHLPILLSVPLSPVFRSNKRLPSFNFQKACWDGFAFTVPLQRNTHLFFFPLLLLFLPLWH